MIKGKGVPTFPRGIRPNMNVIVRVKYGLVGWFFV